MLGTQISNDNKIIKYVYKNLCPATISASIIAANMWKNSVKNVESDNNKILYENLIDYFYSETVLTVRIRLVYTRVGILILATPR